LFATGPALGQYIRKLVGSKEGLKMLRLSAGLDPSTIPEFSVGFRKSDDPTSSLLFSHSHALGHYGYTGTSFWINPENLRYHILLCNRLHKGKRDAAPMREFRSRVYRLHKESLEIS
jgi:CubicO group peptidase (beta-lactamase class C family)